MGLIDTVRETGSTNAELASRLAGGMFVAESRWLVADRQSDGRGRQGRVWFDGSGNFMGSTVVHLRSGDPAAGTLALVAGLAVHEAVSIRLPPPHHAVLKWPNDVMIGNAKLAGILLERIGDAVVVGVGVNLAAAPQLPGRATIALSELTATPDRDSFAQDLARLFMVELERWRNYGLSSVIARWQAAGHQAGTPLSVGEPGQDALLGSFAGLSDDGALQLRLADGTCRIIHAGEVNFAMSPTDGKP